MTTTNKIQIFVSSLENSPWKVQLCILFLLHISIGTVKYQILVSENG